MLAQSAVLRLQVGRACVMSQTVMRLRGSKLQVASRLMAPAGLLIAESSKRGKRKATTDSRRTIVLIADPVGYALFDARVSKGDARPVLPAVLHARLSVE